MKIYRYKHEKTGDLLELHIGNNYFSYKINGGKLKRISSGDLNKMLVDYIWFDILK